MFKIENSGKTSLENEQSSVCRQWLIAVLVNTATITYGLQFGWLSPMTKILKSDLSPTGTALTDGEISILAGGIFLFAAVGVPIYSYIIDAYGRKVGIICIVIPQFLSWILVLVAPNTATLIVARALCGLPAGGCFNVIPIYVKEIAQDNIRGLLGSLITVFQNVGVFCMFAMGASLDYFTVVWLVIWIPVVSLPFLLRAPESPAYLVKIGKADEATAALAYLRGLHPEHHMVRKEVEIMKSEDLHFKSIPNVSLISIFKEKPWRRGFVLMMCMMTLHGMNGSVAITQYAVSLLASLGMTVGPEIQSLSLPLVMVVASAAASGAVDRLGRKPILYLTWSLGAACFFTIGTAMILADHGYSVSPWWIVIAMVVTVAAYAGGISPMPYVIMSELFNFQIRAKLMGVIVTYTWFVCFLQLIIFEAVSKMFGQSTAFYMHAVINFAGIFITIMLPETKGKTVQEIEDELRKK